LFALCAVSAMAAGDHQPASTSASPLRRTHAHNDYEHARPLFDALDQGFTSVEADIFLTDDGLLVAHTRQDLKPERSLIKLYLEPLRMRTKTNGGKVYPNGPQFFLLIDVKTQAKETCTALVKVLEQYADILSVTRDGKFEAKAVTVVVSGSCDREVIGKPAVRYAGIDGRPGDLDSDAAANLIPWISAAWGAVFRWQGDGPMPETERAKLTESVGKAHKRGRLVRFWATPEKEAVWKELLAANVDLINTDQLANLRKFLIANDLAQPKIPTARPNRRFYPAVTGVESVANRGVRTGWMDQWLPVTQTNRQVNASADGLPQPRF
jgi:hypothetical protein